MYKCKKCNKTFLSESSEGIEKMLGMLYCKDCNEQSIEEVSLDKEVITENTSLDKEVKSSSVSGSQAVLNSTSDNSITNNSNNTTNIYNGPVEETIQTEYGVFNKKDLRLCSSCKKLVPQEYYDNSANLCRNCMEREIVKSGDGLYEVGLYKDAIAKYLKAEKNDILPAEIGCKIGRCYIELEDWKNAIKYFALSKKDCISSLYYLGYCYENATNGIKDNCKAESYYRQAAEKGDINAKEKVNLIEEEAAKKREAQRKLEEERKANEIAAQKEKERLAKLAKENEEQIRKAEKDKISARNTVSQNAGKEIEEYKCNATLNQPPLILDKKNDQWGYVDSKGVVVIPHKYDEALPFNNETALVKSFLGWGCINIKGDEIIPTRYNSLYVFKNRLVVLAEKEGCIGYEQRKYSQLLNMRNGERITEGIYFHVKPVNGIVVAYKYECGYGTFNENGTEEIPFVYSKLEYINGVFIAQMNGKYGLLDTKGNTLKPFVFKSMYKPERCKDIIAYKNNICGFIDSDSYEEKHFLYEEIDPSYGMNIFKVKKDGKYGLIKGNGKEIIPFVYENLSYTFHKFKFFDFLIAKKDGAYGIINFAGEELTSFSYNDISIFYDDNDNTFTGKKYKFILYDIVLHDDGRFSESANIMLSLIQILLDLFRFN